MSGSAVPREYRCLQWKREGQGTALGSCAALPETSSMVQLRHCLLDEPVAAPTLLLTKDLQHLLPSQPLHLAVFSTERRPCRPAPAHVNLEPAFSLNTSTAHRFALAVQVPAVITLVACNVLTHTNQQTT